MSSPERLRQILGSAANVLLPYFLLQPFLHDFPKESITLQGLEGNRPAKSDRLEPKTLWLPTGHLSLGMSLNPHSYLPHPGNGDQDILLCKTTGQKCFISAKSASMPIITGVEKERGVCFLNFHNPPFFTQAPQVV